MLRHEPSEAVRTSVCKAEGPQELLCSRAHLLRTGSVLRARSGTLLYSGSDPLLCTCTGSLLCTCTGSLLWRTGTLQRLWRSCCHCSTVCRM